MKRSLHFAGRAVSVYTKGPASRALVDFMFARVPADGKARAHIALHLDDCADGGLSFSIPGSDSSATRGPAEQVVSRLLYEVDYHLADRCRAGVYLHAASLARAGQALLLPASSGSGKSTLTYWLTQNGFHYLSDESSFIPLHSLDCNGFTRPAHLKKGSLALFPQLESQPRQEVHWSDGSLIGWLLATSALNPLPIGQSAHLNQIIFPRYQAGSALSVERLSPARAAFELAGCLTNARNLPEHGFPEILRLARSLPAWRLTYGDVSQTVEFFRSSPHL